MHEIKNIDSDVAQQGQRVGLATNQILTELSFVMVAMARFRYLMA